MGCEDVELMAGTTGLNKDQGMGMELKASSTDHVIRRIESKSSASASHRQCLQQPYDSGGNGIAEQAAAVVMKANDEDVAKVTMTVVTQHETANDSLKASQV